MTQSGSELSKQRQHQTSTQQKYSQQQQIDTTIDSRQRCDILLNNFQIKKKRYRVLFNYNQILWERLESTQNGREEQASHYKTKQETAGESERTEHKKRRVLHMDEVIRVAKGSTKSATFRNIPPQYVDPSLPEPIGSNRSQTQVPASSHAERFLTIHYAVRLIKSETDCNRWRVTALTLYNSDAYIIRQWYELLTQKLSTSGSRLRIERLLVFINPYGGRKQGLRVYERYCKPLFQLAGIDVSCILSQRANQIRDILLAHDLATYDAVCCVGGDGTAAEVINGLIFRRMRDLGYDTRQSTYVPKPTLPIGIIPAGSTDTIAYSLHGTSDVQTAAIHLVLGQRRGLDISSVSNANGVIRFCASVLSYGYLGDVAAKSERYRWMGTKRYEYAGVKAFLSNRGYEAEIDILVPDAIQDNYRELDETEEQSLESGKAEEDSKCFANCHRCTIAPIMRDGDGLRHTSFATTDLITDELPTSSNQTLDSESSVENNDCVGGKLDVGERGNSGDQVDNSRSTQSCDRAGAISETSSKVPSTKAVSVPSSLNSIRPGDCSSTHGNWRTVKGTFFMISGANITCACTRSPNGISRFSHLGDGYLDLVLVRKTTRFNNIRFVINTMGRTGDIRQLPFVEVYRTRKFHFRCNHVHYENMSTRNSCQPIAELDENVAGVSSWNCDGEVINDLDITMNSHCQLVDVFMRGPFSYQKSAQQQDSGFRCCTSQSD